MVAIRMCCLDLVQLLINKDVDLGATMVSNDEFDLQNLNGKTALMMACSMKDLEFVEGPDYLGIVAALIKGGASVSEATTRRNVTALMWASEQGSLEIARLLLDEGADVDAVQTNGDTALILACHKGHLAVVRLLIENYADLNATRADDGMTALMLASKNGHLSIVQLLLFKGAQKCKEDKNGRTAYDLATSPEIKRELK